MNSGGKSFNMMEGLPEPPDKGIYFDNNATTPVAPEVIEKMIPLLSDHFGNPSSMHSFGARAGDEVAEARDKVQSLVGATQSSEIVFTGGGSESDNLAIVGTLHANPNKRHLITTAVEHPAVLGLCRDLEKRHGYEVTYLAVDATGQLDLDELRQSLREDTAVVSIMMANNETGVIFDSEAIGQIVKANGSVFHVDGVQAAGKLPLDMRSSTIDLFSLSGHKLHAPKGVGALYVRKGTKIRPAATRNADAGPGPKTWPPWRGSGWPAIWPSPTLNTKTPWSGDCGTIWKKDYCPQFPIPMPTVIRTAVCPTPRTSASSTSRAKVSFCCSIASGWRPVADRPAPAAASNLPMFCGPWACPLP